MIAAAAHALAGDSARAMRWADDARLRQPMLTQAEFFGAFPIRDESMRRRLAEALISVGFR
jgi:hypothetical protein